MSEDESRDNSGVGALVTVVLAETVGLAGASVAATFGAYHCCSEVVARTSGYLGGAGEAVIQYGVPGALLALLAAKSADLLEGTVEYMSSNKLGDLGPFRSSS